MASPESHTRMRVKLSLRHQYATESVSQNHFVLFDALSQTVPVLSRLHTTSGNTLSTGTSLMNSSLWRKAHYRFPGAHDAISSRLALQQHDISSQISVNKVPYERRIVL